MYNIWLASFFNYLSVGTSLVGYGDLYVERFRLEAAVAAARRDSGTKTQNTSLILNRRGCKFGYELGLLLYIRFCKKFGEKRSEKYLNRRSFMIAAPRVRPGWAGRQVEPADARPGLSHGGLVSVEFS